MGALTELSDSGTVVNERSFGTFSGNGAFMAGYYATVDHALGSAAGRYFGEGHRRSRYSFVTDGLNDGHVVGTSTVWQELYRGT
jgi:hypothetical protein